MKRIYVCSRYAGDIPRNTMNAERLCRRVMGCGHAPFASHLIYARFLDDGVASEREAGMACGLAFLEVCDEVWVFTGDGISDGMRREITHARSLGKPVVELEAL